MTCAGAVAAGMGCQQAQRPKLVWVAAVFGFGAGFADQPGVRRLRDIRLPSRARQVIDGLERSHGGHAADASGDPLAVDAEGCRDLAGIVAVGQVQDNGRPLDMMRRGGARAGECGQDGAGFFSQRQSHRGGFARHAASFGL
jgi:hypothetical protein